MKISEPVNNNRSIVKDTYQGALSSLVPKTE